MGDTPSLPNSKIEAEDRHANFYDARVNLVFGLQGRLRAAESIRTTFLKPLR